MSVTPPRSSITDHGAQLAVVERYPLTPTQHGLLLGTLRHGRGLELHQIVVELEASVDVRRLRDAWDRALSKHAVLRSRIRHTDAAEPIQEVMARVPLPFQIRSVQSLDAFLAEDRSLGLELSEAPSFRLNLLELPDGSAALVFTHHHVMLDGRSQRLLIEGVFRDYDGLEDASPPPRAFRLHCEAMQRRDREAERAYFEPLLKGSGLCELPRTVPLTRPTEPGGGKDVAVVSPGLAMPPRGEVQDSVALHNVDRPFESLPCSTASVLQAAWSVVLGAYCLTDDVTFGVTRNGRHLLDGASDMVGCLINTVATRVDLSQHTTVGELACALHRLQQDVRPFEQASLSEIQGWLRLDRPLFETLLVYERFAFNEALQGVAPSFAKRRFRVVQQSSFPVLLAAYQRANALDLFLEFDATRWGVEGMSAMLARVAYVFTQMLADPSRPTTQLSLLLPGERDKLLRWSQGPLVGMSLSTTIDGRLSLLASKQPDAPAYVHEDGSVTSRAELLALRNRWAAQLRRLLGDPPGAVAVIARRNVDHLALQLAAWTHGWLYVPMDPEWPLQRMVDVCKVVNPGLVVVDQGVNQDALRRALAASFNAQSKRPDVELLQLDSQHAPAPVPRHRAALDDPAYAIFTSGSTGRPKGVLVTQRSLVTHARGAAHTYGLNESSRVLAFASPAFDVAMEESIPTLLEGGCLVERAEGLSADLTAFLTDVGRRRVNLLNLPSGFFHLLMLHLNDSKLQLPACVRTVVIGSEKPTAWSVRLMQSLHPCVRIFNAYGPTEATISSIACDLSALARLAPLPEDIPVGTPWGACEAFLLDRQGRLCPPGIGGEIHIAGDQVAKGYLNAPPELNQRFAPSPINGARMYRTGDLGRLRSDGLIEFLGRVDDQVKVRGVRIELGEIEQVVRRIEGVTDAVVVSRNVGRGTEIVAFVVQREAAALDAHTVKARVADTLPHAFVPSEVRFITELPRQPSGKLDRKAIAAMAAELPATQRALKAPKGDLEAMIFRTFAKLLNRDDFDVEDSFFEAGGHSLLAVQLVGELNRLADKPMDLATVFAAPSVRALAAHISDRRTSLMPSTVPLNAKAQAMLRATSSNVYSGESLKPIFLVCGVNIYMQLARNLRADRAIFGVFDELESRLAAGTFRQVDIGKSDTQQLASAYLKAMKQVQPHGPYIIGGLSFGGVLAYEMAQQLKDQGEEVEWLILLETILPRAIRAPNLLVKLRSAVSNMMAGLTGYELKEALGVFQRKVQRLTRTRPWEELAVLDQVAQRDRLFRQAADAYDRQILPYDGKVMVVRARTPLKAGGKVVDWDLGWSQLLMRRFPIFSVEGDHMGIMDEPGATELAQIIDQHLAS